MSMFRDLKGEIISLKNKQKKTKKDIEKINELERLLVLRELEMFSRF